MNAALHALAVDRAVEVGPDATLSMSNRQHPGRATAWRGAWGGRDFSFVGLLRLLEQVDTGPAPPRRRPDTIPGAAIPRARHLQPRAPAAAAGRGVGVFPDCRAAFSAIPVEGFCMPGAGSQDLDRVQLQNSVASGHEPGSQAVRDSAESLPCVGGLLHAQQHEESTWKILSGASAEKFGVCV